MMHARMYRLWEFFRIYVILTAYIRISEIYCKNTRSDDKADIAWLHCALIGDR